jgi:hypothetical protein
MDYQQRLIYSGSETTTDGSYEPLQMTFSVVVWDDVHWCLNLFSTLMDTGVWISLGGLMCSKIVLILLMGWCTLVNEFGLDIDGHIPG